MKTRAADDFPSIRARLAELAMFERPRCPQGRSTLLIDCLRSSIECPEACPFRADWLGPQMSHTSTLGAVP